MKKKKLKEKLRKTKAKLSKTRSRLRSALTELQQARGLTRDGAAQANIDAEEGVKAPSSSDAVH